MNTIHLIVDKATGALRESPFSLPTSGTAVLEVQLYDNGTQAPLEEINTLAVELFDPESVNVGDIPQTIKVGETYISGGQLTGFTRDVADKSHKLVVSLDTISAPSDVILGRVRFSEDGGAETIGEFFHVRTGASPVGPATPTSIEDVNQYIDEYLDNRIDQPGGIPTLDDSGNLLVRAYAPISLPGVLALGDVGGYFYADIPCQVMGILVERMGSAPVGADIRAHVVDELDQELVPPASLVLDGESRGRWVFDAPLVLAPGDEMQLELEQVGSTDSEGESLMGYWIIQPKQQP